MSKHQQRHISGWPAVLLAPIAIPIVAAIKIGEKLFGFKTTEDLTAADVVSYLQDFIEDRSGEWDWDDFTSIPITDPVLDEIREEAAAVMLPLNDKGEAKLRGLLSRARSLAAAEQPTST